MKINDQGDEGKQEGKKKQKKGRKDRTEPKVELKGGGGKNEKQNAR